MSSEQEHRLEQIFGTARELPPRERATKNGLPKTGAHFSSGHAVPVLLPILWLTLPAMAQAQDYLTTTTNRTITITGYNGPGGEVTIPSRIQSLPVTSIGDYAFNRCSSLTSIKIPNSVTRIGGYSFQGCSILTNVTFGSSVASVGDRAFALCTSLPSIVIPNSVTKIGVDAFRNCTSLTDITIGSSVTNIRSKFSACQSLTRIAVDAKNTVYSSVDGVLFNKNGTTLIQCPEGKAGSYAVPERVTRLGDDAFRNCTGLTHIIIPDSVTTIAWNGFFGCTSLTSVKIGGGITRIGDDAFRNCTRLTDVTIGTNITSIGANAFADCTGLTNTTIPVSVTNIGARAFSWCSRLTGITIADGVTSLGEDAFRGCNTLTDVTIGSSVTNIGTRFHGCYRLSRIMLAALNPVYSSVDGVLLDKKQTTLIRCPGGKTGSYTAPQGITRIGDNAFGDCTGLTNITIPVSVTNIGARAFSWCTGLTGITIPDGVTSIGEDAFRGCTSLADVTIGSSVTNLGRKFSGCYNLRRITVDALNPAFSSVDGVFFNKNQTTLIQCPEGTTGSYTVPKGVTRIEDKAFANCAGLTNVTMPESVTTVGNRAWYYCARLTSLAIPDSATMLGEDAFRGCSTLTDVRLGSSITNIGRRFSECHSLARITVDARNTVYSSIDGVLFNKNQTTLIQCPERKAGSYAVPERVTRIGNDAFADCTSLTNVTIPVSATNIGARAFSWCTGLTTITIPDNVASIGDRAFESCSRLTRAYSKGNAPNLGADVFYNDYKLRVYYLPGTRGWGPTFGGGSATLWGGPEPSHTN